MKFDYNYNILSRMEKTTFFSWVHKVLLRLHEGFESQALAFILLGDSFLQKLVGGASTSNYKHS